MYLSFNSNKYYIPQPTSYSLSSLSSYSSFLLSSVYPAHSCAWFQYVSLPLRKFKIRLSHALALKRKNPNMCLISTRLGKGREQTIQLLLQLQLHSAWLTDVRHAVVADCIHWCNRFKLAQRIDKVLRNFTNWQEYNFVCNFQVNMFKYGNQILFIFFFWKKQPKLLLLQINMHTYKYICDLLIHRQNFCFWILHENNQNTTLGLPPDGGREGLWVLSVYVVTTWYNDDSNYEWVKVAGYRPAGNSSSCWALPSFRLF